MKVSNWIIIDGYCATRIIDGGDQDNIADRVAFIEKTPRVRTAPFTDEIKDYLNWSCGPKGCGGNVADGDVYGFYQPSRDWCDKKLIEMGYEL